MSPLLNHQQSRAADYVLVATIKAILLVSLKGRTAVPIEFHRPEYYGVSWMPGGTELVLSHSRLDNARLINIEDYANSEVGTLSCGTLESPPFLSAPHQILCAPDGRVICTNTGRNAITVFDFARPNCFQECRLSASRWDRLSLDNRCGDHLNSVYLHGNELYVLAHGHQQGSRFAILSYPDLELLSLNKIAWGSGMHNIWRSPEGQLLACHTEDGSLVDLHDGRALWKAGCHVFTRGLAISDDVVLIGESQFSERAGRHSTTSGLWIVDRKSWRTLDYMCLGPFGMVHDVRLLDVKDHAHHGHTFAGLSRLLETVPGDHIRESRLQAAARVEEDQTAWSDFEAVFGSPNLLNNGGREATDSQICLMTQPASRGKSHWQYSFQYALRADATQSHVSAIYYWGNGEDTNMMALLLQPLGDRAFLSLWLNDGHKWECRFNWQNQALPAKGTVTLVATDSKWTMSIDSQVVAEVNANDFYRADGQFGIRVCGACVYPFLAKPNGSAQLNVPRLMSWLSSSGANAPAGLAPADA